MLRELKSLGLKTGIRYNGIEIVASYNKLFEVLHSVHTVDQISMQIGKEFLMRSERDLEKNLERSPFHAFLPVSEIYDKYDPPKVKASVYQNAAISKKRVEEVVQKFVNLLNIRKEYRQIRQLGYRGSIKNLEKQIEEKRHRIDALKKNLQEDLEQKKLIEEIKHSTSEQESDSTVLETTGNNGLRI